MTSMRLARGAAFALFALLALPALHAPAQAQTTAPGPYYAVPSWDQTLPSATRFIVLSNFASQAVLDRETGLVWERAPDAGERTWFNAVEFCQRRELGNRQGWRVPSIQEIRSLVDTAQAAPALPPGHPFTGVRSGRSDIYWSMTTDARSAVHVYTFTFNDAGSLIATPRDFVQLTWCVRGGAGTPE